MVQVKIFRYETLSTLELEVNKFLKETNGIVTIKQTEDKGHITMSIFYDLNTEIN